MTITSSLRFLYIFRGSGLLCGAREAVANGRTEENQRRLPLAAKQRKKVEELLEHGQTFEYIHTTFDK